jgi:hypothetical protein
MDPNQNTEEPNPNAATPKQGKLDVRLVLLIMTKALKGGPKSRERSLLITKLEEARMWAGEAMMVE